jgi:hypothetical protein
MMLPPLTTLSIGAAALLSVAPLLPLASAQSGSNCPWNYRSNCSTSSKQVTYDVTFEVDTGDSNSDNDGYSVTATFYWGDGSENVKITDTFSTGESHTISESHNYDNDGSYLTGFSLVFGDGARGCAGKTIPKMDTLEMGNSCGFSESSALPPAPGPTPDETPEPTPEPWRKETESPTVKPTFAPSVQPKNPPTSNEPVATTTVTTTTIAKAAKMM